MTISPPLSNGLLRSGLPPAVDPPGYDRSALVPGVVHIGAGHFHRAHQMSYFDDLARAGHREWGVVAVGLHTRDARDALVPQDLLYTLVERGAGGDHARVIGALCDYICAAEHPAAAIDALADPRIRLVTLTVTGGGYCLDPVTGLLDERHEAVLADRRDPRRPTTFMGYLIAALRRRRDAGVAPFTVLSCDNLPQNGATARSVVVAQARVVDPGLAEWIERRVAFPSSMVDRIVPATCTTASGLVSQRFGVGDRWPIITEPFRQWVVEDAFHGERPPLEDAGVQLVGDVRPYELMKQRLLNGTHCALGFLGKLAGLSTMDAAMADDAFRGYATGLMKEVEPLLPAAPGVDSAEYRHALLERFANPAIGDSLDRLCRRGSAKIPVHVLPSIERARQLGTPHDLLVLAVAGWIAHLRGFDHSGGRIAVNDPHKDKLQRLARRRDGAAAILARPMFGGAGHDPVFAGQVRRALAQLDRLGPRAAIEAHLQSAPALELVA